MEKNKNYLSVHDKLFLIYNLAMKVEKEKLSKSQFNDLSVNDLHIIHIISLEKNITISQIAKLMAVSKAALTGSIDKLERLQYIKRVPSKTDRRVVSVRLTKKGKLLSRLYNREHVTFIDSLLKNCNEPDKTRLNKILNQLILKLKKRRWLLKSISCFFYI